MGASGDLVPLAHMSAVLIGEGEAYYRDQRLPGAKALERAGLSPVQLEAKDCLLYTSSLNQLDYSSKNHDNITHRVCALSHKKCLGALKLFTCPV